MKSNQPSIDIPTAAFSTKEFSKKFLLLMDSSPTTKLMNPLKAAWLETPLGPMIAIADEDALYVLEFVDYDRLESTINRLRIKLKSTIISGKTTPIILIESELKQYFAGKLTEFKTPLFYIGTSFQKRVWDELHQIPYGETRSYADIARAIKRPTAYRAVARANATNQLAIISPCHRVINSGGKLGGYGSGLHHKKWLLELESSVSSASNS